MLRCCSKILILALAIAPISASTAWSSPDTGNPATDGWDLNGNSLSLGTFVYTNSHDYNKLFNFDVYSKSSHLVAGSSLLGSGWLANDLVVGIGGVIHSGPLNSQVRILAKYGASDATFTASSFAPVNPIPSWSPPTPPFYGDGIGNSSSSGTGGIVLETPQIWGGNPPNTPWFNPSGAGSVVTIDGSVWPTGDPNAKAAKVNRYVSQIGTDITSDGVMKLIYQVNGSGLLSSFETYLNLSLLERKGFLAHPAPGDRFVLAIQDLSSDFTKATGKLSAVPEPSSLVLAVCGLGGLGLVYVRRRRSS